MKLKKLTSIILTASISLASTPISHAETSSTGGGQTVSSKLNQLLNGVQVTVNSTDYSSHGDVVDTGTCGATSEDNVIWTFYEDGLMVISGTGRMADYGINGTGVPFIQYWKRITHLIFDGDVTYISNNSFLEIYNAKIVEIGDSVVEVNPHAFSQIGSSANHCTKLYIGSGMTNEALESSNNVFWVFAKENTGNYSKISNLDVYIKHMEGEIDTSLFGFRDGEAYKPRIYHYLKYDIGDASVDIDIQSTNANKVYDNAEHTIDILSVVLNTQLDKIPLAFAD